MCKNSHFCSIHRYGPSQTNGGSPRSTETFKSVDRLTRAGRPIRTTRSTDIAVPVNRRRVPGQPSVRFRSTDSVLRPLPSRQ